MGTPDFAVASLDALMKSSHEVVAVVTVADKPAGRGKKVHTSAVKDYALSHQLPVLQPLKLKDPEFLNALSAFKADLFAVVAFRMLPEAVWAKPPKGTINLHGSLLPKYRGAAPINWAVINGDSETGYSTFFINEEIDKGALLFQERIDIGADEDAGSLHDRMMIAGAELLVKTIDAIEDGTAVATLQENSSLQPSHAPKLNNDNRRIDWSRSSDKVKDLIRGLSPYPSAFSILKDGNQAHMIKFFKSKVCDDLVLSPGSWASDGKSHLYIGTGDKALSILELQLAGKRRMSINDLLNGWSLPPESYFE